MPELPEVETVRVGLAKLLTGKKIVSATSNWSKSWQLSQQQEEYISGSVIKSVDRRAKVLMINLSSGYSLVVHLKMTGQLVYRSKDYSFGAGHPSDSLVGKLPDSSTRVEIIFSDQSKLFFNDQRKFGWIKLIETKKLSNRDFFKNTGPDPLEKEFTTKLLKDRLSRYKKRAIKAALLDQSIIAGLGNIYVDESLWAAKIHPLTPVCRLNDNDITNLQQAIVDVLKLSIAKGGSTNRNYVNAEGTKGSYMNFARVYKRDGEPCSRCGEPIVKIRVAGRGTHICPNCQIALLK